MAAIGEDSQLSQLSTRPKSTKTCLMAKPNFTDELVLVLYDAYKECAAKATVFHVTPGCLLDETLSFGGADKQILYQASAFPPFFTLSAKISSSWYRSSHLTLGEREREWKNKLIF